MTAGLPLCNTSLRHTTVEGNTGPFSRMKLIKSSKRQQQGDFHFRITEALENTGVPTNGAVLHLSKSRRHLHKHLVNVNDCAVGPTAALAQCAGVQVEYVYCNI